MRGTQMIITDLDRTLLDDQKQVSQYTIDTFAQCRARGIRVVFATARPERAALRYIDAVKPDFVISNNGATISDTRNILRVWPISMKILGHLTQTFVSSEQITMITLEAHDCLYTNHPVDADDPGWSASWKPVYHDFSLGLPAGGQFTKISVQCEDFGVLQAIMRWYPELHMHANYGESWHQIMTRSASKINAVDFLARQENCSLRDVVAFGDDQSDIEMLLRSGVGVAVANAIPEARQAADVVCGSNNEDGVARWINQHILDES